MKIHHLNCGTLCPHGGALLGGTGAPWSRARMCCHCLLIEGRDGLILIDSGLGIQDVSDPRRLGFLFNALISPRLDIEETAARQVAGLGFALDDVRHIVPTHLDLDHAGGLVDFPAATVHVFAPELKAALNPGFWERSRYRAAQLKGITAWAPVEGTGGEAWFGFESVRAMPGSLDRVLLIPLPGHSRGHCGVAIETAGGWLLHCGDAYFHHTEITPEVGKTPAGIRWFESLVNVDGKARLANQARLVALARTSGHKVRLICSHDPAELADVRAPAPAKATTFFRPQRTVGQRAARPGPASAYCEQPREMYAPAGVEPRRAPNT